MGKFIRTISRLLKKGQFSLFGSSIRTASRYFKVSK
ncbi:hypothetical protein Bhyg_09111 [Pseudolycoriella hygida]|uniref:Uncharacterized protein n=1 Tax=Pseudolycoriella hygida TaxID=35572 RepID=A0A9Q0S5L0_9DIPT|nr:hypothetical protein Bhyg_09111 [Pseudolycoriella hygida]